MHPRIIKAYAKNRIMLKSAPEKSFNLIMTLFWALSPPPMGQGWRKGKIIT
jgi:hypothetical protein